MQLRFKKTQNFITQSDKMKTLQAQMSGTTATASRPGIPGIPIFPEPVPREPNAPQLRSMRSNMGALSPSLNPKLLNPETP